MRAYDTPPYAAEAKESTNALRDARAKTRDSRRERSKHDDDPKEAHMLTVTLIIERRFCTIVILLSAATPFREIQPAIQRNPRSARVPCRVSPTTRPPERRSSTPFNSRTGKAGT
jgi:hypothetical protein